MMTTIWMRPQYIENLMLDLISVFALIVKFHDPKKPQNCQCIKTPKFILDIGTILNLIKIMLIGEKLISDFTITRDWFS